MPIHMSVACKSVRLSAYLPVCLFVFLSFCLSVCPPACLPACQSVCLSIFFVSANLYLYQCVSHMTSQLIVHMSNPALSNLEDFFNKTSVSSEYFFLRIPRRLFKDSMDSRASVSWQASRPQSLPL
jgi:hypothetical protein